MTEKQVSLATFPEKSYSRLIGGNVYSETQVDEWKEQFEGLLRLKLAEIETESRQNTEWLRNDDPKSEKRNSVLFARIEAYQWVIKNLKGLLGSAESSQMDLEETKK